MCRGTDQLSETELIIPVVNNAPLTADAVPRTHGWAVQIPLVCRQVGKETEGILNNISCDTWHQEYDGIVLKHFTISKQSCQRLHV